MLRALFITGNFRRRTCFVIPQRCVSFKCIVYIRFRYVTVSVLLEKVWKWHTHDCKTAHTCIPSSSIKEVWRLRWFFFLFCNPNFSNDDDNDVSLEKSIAIPSKAWSVTDQLEMRRQKKKTREKQNSRSAWKEPKVRNPHTRAHMQATPDLDIFFLWHAHATNNSRIPAQYKKRLSIYLFCLEQREKKKVCYLHRKKGEQQQQAPNPQPASFHGETINFIVNLRKKAHWQRRRRETAMMSQQVQD